MDDDGRQTTMHDDDPDDDDHRRLNIGTNGGAERAVQKVFPLDDSSLARPLGIPGTARVLTPGAPEFAQIRDMAFSWRSPRKLPRPGHELDETWFAEKGLTSEVGFASMPKFFACSLANDMATQKNPCSCYSFVRGGRELSENSRVHNAAADRHKQ